MDDVLLLSRYARQRDPDAFSELIRRHSGLVFGICMRVLGDRHRAEDASQECFLALAEQAGSIRHSLAAWLHRVALHIALREKRRARGGAEIDVSQLPAPQVEAWRTLAPQLDAALDALPEDMRDLVSRRYLGGASQAELAAELGVTQATISRRLQQAVAHLRQRLDAHLDDQAMHAALGCALVAPPQSLIATGGRIGLAGHGVSAAGSAGLGLKSAVLLLSAAVAIPIAFAMARSSAPPATSAPASVEHAGARPAAAAEAGTPPPAPPPAQANPLLAQKVTIDVSGWPLDRVVATLADQLDLDGGMQAMPDGHARRLDTRLEIMPCRAGWPLCDAVADHRPLGEVLDRLMGPTHSRLLVSDRIVLVSRPMTDPLAPLIAQLWAARDGASDAIQLIAGSGDAEAVAQLLGALASPEADAATAKAPAAAQQLQEGILSAVASCGCTWQSWLPSGDQMRIVASLPQARSGVAAALSRCRAQRFPVPESLIYLSGQVGGGQVVADLEWIASHPDAALPGLPANSPEAGIALATERAWAIKALGRAGARDALPLMRAAWSGAEGYDVQLAGLMALGECGEPADADLFAAKPLGGAWITGATAYVAAYHLSPDRLGPLFALRGSIYWGMADAFMGYPFAPQLDAVLDGAGAPQWWVRWAMWKGTGRMDPALVDAAIRARSARGPIAPALEAILARDGDDQALDQVVASILGNAQALGDADARCIEDLAQELCARLAPKRQQRALATLRAGLDLGHAPDAALSMLRAQSSPALADELMSGFLAGGRPVAAAPAILRALAQMRVDRARAFIAAQLGSAAGPGLCRGGLTYREFADPALRTLLEPMLAGGSHDLAIALATCGMAAYPDTLGKAGAALAREAASLENGDLQRLRDNLPPNYGQMPAMLLDALQSVQAQSADAAVRRSCVDFASEIARSWLGPCRVEAARIMAAGVQDADGGVRAFAQKKLKGLMQPSPFAQDDGDFYCERLVMAGSMDASSDVAAMDKELERIRDQAAAPAPAQRGQGSGATPAASNF